jgi:hypothetical protein
MGDSRRPKAVSNASHGKKRAVEILKIFETIKKVVRS